MPPPKHLKEARKKHIEESEKEDSLPAPKPSPPSSRTPAHPNSANSSANMIKVGKQGLPKPPSIDFELPATASLCGTVRERISLLCESILQPSFIVALTKGNQFEVRAHYRAGEPGEHLHLGEIYEHGTSSTPGHAWLIIVGKGVWQWHFIHPACETQGTPTFLQSIENYLMYVHLRIGQPLPKGFDF